MTNQDTYANENITVIMSDYVALKAEIEKKTAQFNEEISGMKELKDRLQETISNKMKEMDMTSVKNSAGSFVVKSKKGFTFKNEIEAIKWASENGAMSIDRRLAAQKLNSLDVLPDFVEEVNTEYLQFLPKKEKKEE